MAFLATIASSPSSCLIRSSDSRIIPTAIRIYAAHSSNRSSFEKGGRRDGETESKPMPFFSTFSSPPVMRKIVANTRADQRFLCFFLSPKENVYHVLHLQVPVRP